MSSEARGSPDEVPSADAIDAVSLPDSILGVVESYEAAGGERDRYLWQWIYDLVPAFTLSSVPSSRTEAVRHLKTELTVFVTLLDDLAEKSGDVETFDAIRHRVLWPGSAETGAPPGTDAGDAPAVDTALFEFAADLWGRIDASLQSAPRYEEFASIFEYDLRQVVNAMDYCRVVNDHPAIANLAGARRYDSHNMVAFPYADVDLMHSPAFERTDLAPTRAVLWDLQAMARIGNWLTTWKREIREGDLSSGLVVYALHHGLVSPETLDVADDEGCEALIDLIESHRVEACFEAEWRHLYRQVQDRDYDVASVDLEALLEGMELVMAHHVASVGRK